MHTKDFSSIPKRMFITKQPVRSEILENPFYRNKAAQLSLMQRDTPKTEENVEKADRVVQTEATENEQEESEKMDSISDDSEMEPFITKKKPKITFESIMAKMKLKETHEVKRAEIVLAIILQSDIVTIGEESSLIYINNESTDIQVSPFLYDLQQPSKKK